MNNSRIKTVNPATEEIIEEYEVMTKEQINDSVKKARNAFQEGWKKDIKKRADFLYNFAHEISTTKKS